MFLIKIIPAAALLAAALPAAAQTMAAPPETPANAAADQREQPVTDSLNNAVDNHIAATSEANAVNQGQYANDMAAYHDAVMANHEDAMRDRARYERQQRAYADAMADWRMQTDACNRGKLKACKLPTPNPADYY